MRLHCDRPRWRGRPASGDVAAERSHVAEVAAALNRNIGAERDVQFQVCGWETDVRPRVHKQGPQGAVDEDLPVEECDIVAGILWKRLGAGNEHEIRSAIASGKPEVVVCFNDALYRSTSVEESKQATRVLEFREEMRGRARRSGRITAQQQRAAPSSSRKRCGYGLSR